MAGVTKTERRASWNVQIFVKDKIVAGVYQRDNLLSVADIAHELELCFVFDKPDSDTLWQPALLPKEPASRGLGLIVLNH
ncbi:hypothetical protein VP1G_04349 [Cytospora mali]|uniref:Uncharacterized protein n=1 Tax=Cytospora mali TaxID=578113 RepID=A0A194UZG1_CYTMA|nr:hypothetical protein VP1G_04349 [Valsa mali var. pyri (nom. inval.)]